MVVVAQLVSEAPIKYISIIYLFPSLDPVHCSLGWSGSLLCQTEAVLICDYGREQTVYRYIFNMTPLQRTQTIPFNSVLT